MGWIYQSLSDFVCRFESASWLLQHLHWRYSLDSICLLSMYSREDGIEVSVVVLFGYRIPSIAIS